MKYTPHLLSILSLTFLILIFGGCKPNRSLNPAEGIPVYGPEKIVMMGDEPILLLFGMEIENFDYFGSPFLLIIDSADNANGANLPDIEVDLDGKQIIGQGDLEKADGILSRRINLTENSAFRIKFEGDQGSSVRIRILGFLEDNLLADIDGNIYHTVKIGNQVWMTENLKVTHFNDGSVIPVINNSREWYNLTSPACCWYNNDIANFESYGALYNYYAINSDKLAPEGWHVPTEDEFRILISNLDPEANFVRHESSTTAGGMLKENGLNYWAEPNAGATNESGFAALPGGCRSYAGNFSTQGTFGYFGGTGEQTVLSLRFATGSAFLRDEISKYVGVSVRCVKD